MTEPNRPDRPRLPPEQRSRGPLGAALVVALLALGAILVWRLWAPEPPLPVTVPAPPTETAAAAPDTSTPAQDQAPAAPVHPVVQAEQEQLTEDASARFGQELSGLFGGKAAQSLLPENLAQRVVATVDNLARSHAPARMWPVAPTPGRFQVIQSAGDTLRVDPENDARYTAFVTLAESVDMTRLAALYARFYPLFQRAYAEIGFPGQHFNDRLVAVIDHLLQAPRPTQPIELRLVEVRSETPAPTPWVRYEFADPALESLSAGQKIMIRIGPGNRRRLDALLTGLRGKVADGALGQGR